MTDESTTNPRPETTRFFVDALSDVNAEQLAAVEGRDSKAVQVFAAASVVLGLVAASDRALDQTLFVVAIGAYVAAAIATGYAIWPRAVFVRPYDELWENLHHESVDDARHTLVDVLATAYPDNERILTEKRWALAVAIAATGIETVLVAAALASALGEAV